MRVAVFGASGLVGQELIKELSCDPKINEIHLFMRRALAPTDARIVVNRTDFSRGWESQFLTQTYEVVFCALGTTIKQAGSRAAFRAVDYDLIMQVGKFAQQTSARQLIIVSALGANPNSKIFYNRVKGEVERDLESLKINSLVFLRPSLLLGERSQRRLGEKVGESLMGLLRPIMVGSLRKYRAIEAKHVAKTMKLLAFKNQSGVRRFESDEVYNVATGKNS